MRVLCFTTLLVCLSGFGCWQSSEGTDPKPPPPPPTIPNEVIEPVDSKPTTNAEDTQTAMEPLYDKPLAMAVEVFDEIPMAADFVDAIPKDSSICNTKYGCLHQALIPIGWSEDGKFAYLLEHANEAVDNLQLDFIIQDMETDELVVKESWKAEDQPDYKEEGQYTTSMVWEQEWDHYQEVLDYHAIEQGKGTALYELPYVYRGGVCSFTKENTMTISDYTGNEVIKAHKLYAVRTDGASKRIRSATYNKYELMLQTTVLGVFRSPYEARIAVLEGEEQRGYEGPPNVLRLQLVGCHLEEGYPEFTQ